MVELDWRFMYLELVMELGMSGQFKNDQLTRKYWNLHGFELNWPDAHFDLGGNFVLYYLINYSYLVDVTTVAER